jgi:hypothetical protein
LCSNPAAPANGSVYDDWLILIQFIHADSQVAKGKELGSGQVAPNIFFWLSDIKKKDITIGSFLNELVRLFPGYRRDRGKKLHPFHIMLQVKVIDEILKFLPPNSATTKIIQRPAQIFTPWLSILRRKHSSMKKIFALKWLFLIRYKHIRHFFAFEYHHKRAMNCNCTYVISNYLPYVSGEQWENNLFSMIGVTFTFEKKFCINYEYNRLRFAPCKSPFLSYVRPG